MSETKEFPLRDILSITTDRLVSRSHMGGTYGILNYMTGDNLFTHQLPRAMRECAPWLLRQHPQLAGLEVPELDEDTAMPWLEQQEARFGASLPVQPIPRDDHARRDPLEELVEMVGPKKVIALEMPDERR